jgi:hypothetical protein
MSSASPSPDREQLDDGDSGPDYTGMPTWMKAFLAAVAVLIIVLLIATWLGGEHGPGRHMSRDVPGINLGQAPTVIGVP